MCPRGQLLALEHPPRQRRSVHTNHGAWWVSTAITNQNEFSHARLRSKTGRGASEPTRAFVFVAGVEVVEWWNRKLRDNDIRALSSGVHTLLYHIYVREYDYDDQSRGTPSYGPWTK